MERLQIEEGGPILWHTKEEQEREKRIQNKKKEEDEERWARATALSKIEDDKRRRRREMGLPEELTKEEQVVIDENRRRKRVEELASKLHGARFVRPTGTIEDLRTCLVGMKRAAAGSAAFETACGTIKTYIGNVAKDPCNERYRKIRLWNERFRSDVLSVPGGMEFMERCGFKVDHSGEFLELSRERVEAELLAAVCALLAGAMESPLFGSHGK
eukprot:evm.model.scf_3895.1 EVM.evm.TU.scf_3895.1   scf_3895:2474-4991(+)